MQQNTSIVRWFFIMATAIVVGLIVWNTLSFFNELKENERQKMQIFSYFQGFYKQFCFNLYQRNLKAITQKKYASHFLIRPLDFSLEIRESNLLESPPKNLEAVSKKEGHTSAA